jgi:molybdenum cofactor cytidylyltransferase
LIRSPCHAGSRIAEFHLRAAALTTDVEISVAHRGDSSLFHNGNVIPALVLAAGRSTRMGRSKAMLPLDGRDTFLTRIVRTFHDAAVDDVVVVVGHEAGEVRATFEPSGLPARFVENREYDRGQLSSLLAGLSVGAVLVTLVDVPLVAATTVRAVIDRYRQTHAPIVRPISGARHGHPLLIDRSLFALLRAADPAAGAKPIVRAYASSEGDVAVGDEGAFVDIDTSDDYERFVISRADFPAGGGRDGRREGT